MKDVNDITVSIVSHGQFNILLPLLSDLRDCKSLKKIILTINIEEEIVKPKWIRDLPIFWIYNKSVKGFGSNHNNAFKFCKTKYFCVLNPDIRLGKNVLADLIFLKENEKVNIIGPSIINVKKIRSLNSRKFPGLLFLLTRIFMRPKEEFFHKENDNILLTDWIGGMFLVFSSKDYLILDGFDTDYFLYFEDVDICKRAIELGFKVAQSKHIVAIHDAQRRSYSNLLHFMYHIKSYFLYLIKHPIKLNF